MEAYDLCRTSKTEKTQNYYYLRNSQVRPCQPSEHLHENVVPIS